MEYSVSLSILQIQISSYEEDFPPYGDIDTLCT
jgi:hypothetical protein